MLTHPTLDKLQALKFTGMATALAEQMQMPDMEELTFEERLGLLVDREATERENRRLSSRLVWTVLDAQDRPLAHGRPTLRGRWDLGIGRGPDLPAGSARVVLPRSDQLPPAVRAAWGATFELRLFMSF